MRLSSFVSLSLFAGLAFQPATASSDVQLKPRRTTSILSNPAAQPNLPSVGQTQRIANAPSLDLNNIQGDILIGMKKKVELFYFFQINDVKGFKSSLNRLTPRITTTTQLLDVSTQPDVAINIAFSQTGLTTLGINDTLGDSFFSGGQFADASNLGDPGTINWVNAFKGTNIHGVFLLASDSIGLINSELLTIETLFNVSISRRYTLQGQVRPGEEEGHEHFGFMDGISQPGITGFTADPKPGQVVIDPGHILLGESGDNTTRPAWAKDGSFLAFRQLKQLVPEFNKFLTDNPIIEPGLTRQQGSDLLGARMVGRWKSGAPVDLTPLFDDPILANDTQRNNNFTFAHPGENIMSNQTRCPFSAHIRKTFPRADLSPDKTIDHHIIRGGIPYGPEVSPRESTTNTTQIERGLAFVAYQSDIGNGFRFLQMSWANNFQFVFGKSDTTPGFDPIIGANNGQARFVSGLDPTNSSRDFTLVTDFVQSRGGEYFFSPSISAITTVFTN